MTTVTKRSRFNVERQGKPFRITRNDLDILDTLQPPFKYQPSTYIIARLQEPCPQYVKNRLTVLRHEAGVIEVPPSSWHAANARYRPAVYQLTDKGREVLKQHGRYRHHIPNSEEFAHEFGVCLVMASLTIGAKLHPAIRMHGYEAILNSKHCPAATRQLRTPFQIPISFNYRYSVGSTHRTKALDTFVKHDGTPFGFTNPEKPEAQLFFPGIEFDRHTTRLESEDYAATAISKKLQAMRALAAMDGYAAHYGIPNTFIPWVAINEARMHSIMREVEKLTSGKGSKMFLFTHMPDFASFESLPAADGSMLTRNWKRVGYPNFNILTELGVK